MTLPRTLPALAASCLLSTPAVAVPVTANLDVVEENGFNEISLSFQPPFFGDPGEDTTTLSGEVELLLEVDPSTGQVSEMTITDGTISGTPLRISESQFFVGRYELNSSVIGADLTTPEAPGIVDPATGEYDASQHNFTVSSGTLGGSISITLAGINEELSFDFEEMPVGGAGSGTGTVTLTLLESSETSKTYDAVVLLPISVVENFAVPESPLGDLEIPISATGTAKLGGTVVLEIIPEDPFVLWTEANGIPGVTQLEDTNGDSVPNGLQWALGLDAETSPFPHLLTPSETSAQNVGFTITLPDSGSVAPLTVLSTDDPSGSFNVLNSGAVSAGNPIPAGTSGTVSISLPRESRGFLRLMVGEPR